MGTVNSKSVFLLHNYPFGTTSTTPGTPTPHFILLPVDNRQQEIAKPGVSSTPLVLQSPFLIDLGFTRHSTVLNLVPAFVLDANRNTQAVTIQGETRTYTEYSATELEELFTFMQFSLQEVGKQWQLIHYGDFNSLYNPTRNPQRLARTYYAALSSANKRYDDPEDKEEIVATFITSSIVGLDFEPTQ